MISGRLYRQDDRVRRLLQDFNDDSKSSKEGCYFWVTSLEWR